MAAAERKRIQPLRNLIRNQIVRAVTSRGHTEEEVEEALLTIEAEGSLFDLLKELGIEGIINLVLQVLALFKK
jgi:hypothetical protein